VSADRDEHGRRKRDRRGVVISKPLDPRVPEPEESRGAIVRGTRSRSSTTPGVKEGGEEPDTGARDGAGAGGRTGSDRGRPQRRSVHRGTGAVRRSAHAEEVPAA
jgi:hypothetical protein